MAERRCRCGCALDDVGPRCRCPRCHEPVTAWLVVAQGSAVAACGADDVVLAETFAAELVAALAETPAELPGYSVHLPLRRRRYPDRV